jgi:hypothetical protein
MDQIAIERWFCERGFPSFSRTRRVRSPRVMGLLAGSVMLAEIAVLAPSKDWRWYWDVLAVISSLCGAGVAFVLLRRAPVGAMRGVVRKAGEVVMVCGIGALLAVVDSVRVGLEVAALNAALVLVALSDERFGFLFILRRGVGIAVGEAKSAARHMQRSVPVLVVVLLSLFVAGETWQIAAGAPIGNLVLVTVLLMVFGVVTASSRSRVVSEETDVTALSGTPADGMTLGAAVVMTRAERWNLAGIVGLATACLATAAALLFAGLLAVLGVFLVPQELLATWIGGEVDAVTFGGAIRVTFSFELLKIITLMSGVAALVFCVSLLSDDSFRDSAQHALEDDVRQALAVRRAYLHALGE